MALQSSYSKGSKWLHWLVAVVVITMLSLSFFLDDLPESYKPVSYMIHKSFGLTVLFLMVLRLIWIMHSGRPAWPDSVAKWERIISSTVQTLMYLFLFLMPICGWTLSLAAGRVP